MFDYVFLDVLCCLIGNVLIIGRELSDAVVNEEEVAAGVALGSQTSELGSGTPWAEADRGRELEQMREQETRSGFRVRRIAG
ncbi:hypothetical protein DY000_02046169 [Brassica cretica]|uniref:Uncharacterized protein n=1 Tax=Brassica cretica TaxID=69181 RepID=A0ABQ7F3M0_BRACR|nr:hypothetical protein DY000_02046169 [Brassica cretica]